jgi:nucleoside-diphosphate-sugar epimerase
VKIALVGGIGYIGGRLARFLKSKGHHVRVTTRRSLEDVPSWLSADQVVRNDLTNETLIRKHLADRDVIIYLASPDERETERDPGLALRAASETVWTVLQAICGLSQKPRFLFLSTFHVYGQAGGGNVTENTPLLPIHPYGMCRAIGETITHVFRRRHGFQTLCVRLSNVFGPPADVTVSRWELLLGDLCLQVVTQKKIVLRSPPTTQRNFISMEDCLRGLEFLAHSPTWPADGVIHLGSPQNLTLDQVAHRLAQCAKRMMGVTPPIVCLSKSENTSSLKPLKYSIRRLRSMGFSWTNLFDREISNTLTMCLDAYEKWGKNIFNICGLPPPSGRRPELPRGRRGVRKTLKNNVMR